MTFRALRRKLLAWFDRHQRDLPWRRNRDPYRIWVSEVMLQQTTVAAVIPYFRRFLSAFPTVNALAAADEQRVLHLWQGLGYYRRAKHLHRAARMLAAMNCGIPDDPEIWRALPGVGRYILGAVLSQAFDRRLPIIEANSQRVLCRLFGQTGDPKSTPVQKWLWETAEQVLPRKRIGDLNQALMELGALICTPNEPRCEQCPVNNQCTAFTAGRQHLIPLRTAKPTVTAVREVALIIRKRDRVLLVQRREDAVRWAGMWEFPRSDVHAGESLESAAQRLLRQLGLHARLGAECDTVKYSVTRFRITLSALVATTRGGPVRPVGYAESRWLRPSELAQYPQGTAQRKLTQLLSSTC